MIFALMILTQLIVLIGGGLFLAGKFPYIYYACYLIAGVILIIIINKDEPAEFKLTWAVIIILLPVLGVTLYLFNASNWGMPGLRNRVNTELICSNHLIRISNGTERALLEQPKVFQRFAYYMYDKCCFPTFHNTRVTYYPTGAEKLEALIEELKKAEKFIFIEYFIIGRGEIWDRVLAILKEKVTEGVEVKVMYDGLCSLLLLPYRYPYKLSEYGIEAKMFAPLIPFLSTAQNNRDHRKIVVIDGKVAFTGGVNLSDEYAGLKIVYGHWKDVGIKLEGRAVLSFTRMFIQNWNLYGKIEMNYEKYLDESAVEHFDHDGFVIPYGDVPTDDQEVGKTVYSDLFVNATEYVHIMMPYFIVDREFYSTVRYAALRGIDVRLILPHIPDKKAAFAMARSFYPDLLSSGVKVYEYTPGFVHAKIMVSDDIVATVGSVNLDYRSFYHHFENGVYLYDSSVISQIEDDFQKTMQTSMQVDMVYYKKINVFARAFGRVLRLFAPLM
ncbi:MAG: cardiolipin synthase [Lachnospiraceae bacterium]|nr:cardiolipin synthase [Lachnospiraceae bacterium]